MHLFILYHKYTPVFLGKVIYHRNYNKIRKVYDYYEKMTKSYFLIDKQEFGEVGSYTKGGVENNLTAAPSVLNHIQPKVRRSERIAQKGQGTAWPQSAQTE